MTDLSATIYKRFENKFIPEPNSGCWLWTAHVNKGGYGEFWYKDHNRLAHRVSYCLYKGNIPETMCVCHSCDNPLCVNPDHLFLGTSADNTNDRHSKGRTKVPKGIKLTKKDVIDIRNSTGTTHAALAAQYGVTRSNISTILANKSWKGC